MRSSGIFSSEEAEDYMRMGVLNGLFVLGRSIGLIAHYLDQKRVCCHSLHLIGLKTNKICSSELDFTDILGMISLTFSQPWPRVAVVKAELKFLCKAIGKRSFGASVKAAVVAPRLGFAWSRSWLGVIKTWASSNGGLKG